MFEDSITVKADDEGDLHVQSIEGGHVTDIWIPQAKIFKFAQKVQREGAKALGQ